MQIGEFAKICGTKITVLRHYDKEGLLEPDYVDAFTGYRYYSNEQIPIFFRITALKKAGFSLMEIKKILTMKQSNDALLDLFEKKQTELSRMIEDLNEARKIMAFQKTEFDVKFRENDGKILAESTVFNANHIHDARMLTDSEISAKRYQRISSYQICSIPNSNHAYLICEVIKLDMNAVNIHDPIGLPFENDESVIGKWEIIGEYAVKEDFYEGWWKGSPAASERLKSIYFLPGGNRYWCYAWTKGKLLRCADGDTTVNPYTIEHCGDSVYMFVEMKSYEYRYGGRPTVLVLRQVDHVAYRAEEIRKKDNVDLPFVADAAVIGDWRAYDCVKTKERFDPAHPAMAALALSGVCFAEGGAAFLIYDALEKKRARRYECRWTKGTLIHTGLACAYEIRLIDGREYLFLEWKNGDYVYGGCDPWHYVFVRG